MAVDAIPTANLGARPGLNDPRLRGEWLVVARDQIGHLASAADHGHRCRALEVE